MSTYYARLRYETDYRQVLRSVIEDLSMPIFLTSATTAIGFLSLLWIGTEPIQHLGLFAALGVLLAGWILLPMFARALLRVSFYEFQAPIIYKMHITILSGRSKEKNKRSKNHFDHIRRKMRQVIVHKFL